MKSKVKLLITVLIIAGISVGAFFLSKALGITSVDKLREIIAHCGAWSWIVFIILFNVCAILLCFVPVISAAFIAVSVLLFGPIKGFIISTLSVFLCSSIMFCLGNTLGEKVAIKIVGKESLEQAQNLLDVKSKIFLPLMFMFPIFPDDALCFAAGMTKMKYWYFAIVTLLFRTIGIVTICFLGGGIIDWKALSWVDWVCLIHLAIFDIYLVFRISNKLEKRILNKNKKEVKMKGKIDFKWIVKIQSATMRIFEAEDEDYPDYRIIRANERAINHYLDLITNDKEEQSKILKAIEQENFNVNDMTFKPVCDNLRTLGYEVEGTK